MPLIGSGLLGSGTGGGGAAPPPPPPPAAPDPSTIANLAGWWKADAGITQSGGTVSAWADQSGNSKTLSQGTATNQPSFQASGAGTLGTLPFLRFDGVDNYMTSTIPSTGNWTWCVVTANKRTTLADKIDTLITVQENAGSFNGIEMYSFHYYVNPTQRTLLTTANGATIVSYKNNATTPLTLAVDEWAYLLSTITGQTAPVGINLTFGRDKGGGLYAQVDIAEMFLYSRVINSTERTTIQTYLTERYG